MNNEHIPTEFRRRRRLAAALAMASVGAVLSMPRTSRAASEIKVGGTGNALGAMRLLGQAFTLQNPDIKVVVLPSLGTSGAIKALPKRAIDIGLSSRPLTADEAQSGAVATEYARCALVFAVSVRTAANGLSLQQLEDIYAGRLLNWPDGSQIRPVLRQAGDDNTHQLRKISATMDRALSIAEQRPGMPFATNDQETAEKLETIPGALGVTTLGLIQSEQRALKALAVDGVEPTAANGASGRYPYVKHFHFITRTEPSADVKRFAAFILSPAGRAVLARTGHWFS